MMHELLTFAGLGFTHILSPGGADHLLFLLVLASGFQAGHWRRALWTVSAFTIGHSLTLALAITDTLRVPAAAVEVLIPLTIVAAAWETLRRGGSGSRGPALAAVFGTIHGAGFAGYLRDLFEGGIGVPLAGFNLGIEAAQVVVLGVFVAGFRVVDRALPAVQQPAAAVRLRLVAVAISAGLAGLLLAARRLPWS